MKINEDYALREVAGNYLLVFLGENSLHADSIITLNETGAFLWKLLEKDTDEEALVKALLSEYDTDEENARNGVQKFIESLKEKKILE